MDHSRDLIININAMEGCKLKMSEILFKIKVKLKIAMIEESRLRKEGITSGKEFDDAIAHKTVSRAIISMFPEIGIKPDKATDDDCIKLLKKYISQEKERQLYLDKHLTQSDIEGVSPKELKKLVGEKLSELGDNLTSQKIKIASDYLPKQASKEEIVKWIEENIDFSTYKNKMQAMGPIMKNFKGCDGNFIKDILLKI